MEGFSFLAPPQGIAEGNPVFAPNPLKGACSSAKEFDLLWLCWDPPKGIAEGNPR